MSDVEREVESRKRDKELSVTGIEIMSRERLTMSVMVGRSIGRHCFRIDVGNWMTEMCFL